MRKQKRQGKQSQHCIELRKKGSMEKKKRKHSTKTQKEGGNINNQKGTVSRT